MRATTRHQINKRVCTSAKLMIGFAAVFFVTMMTSLDLKAAPTCENLFNSSAKTLVLARVQKFGDEAAKLAARIRARPFNVASFDRALTMYRAIGTNPRTQLKTREQRLAFLHYVAETSGPNPYDLELWARQATPKELHKLTDALGKFDLKSGFSPSRIDDIYWKLFQFSTRSPNKLRNLRKLGLEQMDRIALEQWTTKEIASASATEAFEKLGLMKDQNMRGRWKDYLRDHPNSVSNIVTGAVMVLQTLILHSPVTIFDYSKLRTTKLDPALRELIEREGFDAAYPALKEKYGRLADFDRSFYFARRAVTVGLMSFMLVHMYPTVMRATLPPELLHKDENAIELTIAVTNFYTQLGRAIISDRIHGSGENEINVRTHTGPIVVQPTVIAADGSKITPNRAPVTFAEQLKNPDKVTPAQADNDALDSVHLPGDEKSHPDDDATTKAARANLNYLDKLDFSDPTQH